MRVIKPKTIAEKLNQNWTTDQFVNYYQYSSAEEFISALKQVYNSRSFNSICEQLAKNDRKAKKNARRAQLETLDSVEQVSSLLSDAFETSAEGVEVVSEEVTEFVEDNTPTTDIGTTNEAVTDDNTTLATDTDTANESTNTDNRESVEELRRRQQKLLEEISRKELEHKDLLSEKNESQKNLLRHKSALEALQSKLKELEENVKKCIANIDVKAEAMLAITRDIKAKKNELKKVETEIKNRQKVSILIYESGSIELETEMKLVIPEAPLEMVKDLVFNELAGGLTVNQLKGITQVVLLTHKLSEDGVEYEIIFDNPMIEQLYCSL